MKSIIFLSLLIIAITLFSTSSVNGAPSKSKSLKRAVNNSNSIKKHTDTSAGRTGSQRITDLGKPTSTHVVHPQENKKLEKSLLKRNVRTVSGGSSSKTSQTTRRTTTRHTTSRTSPATKKKVIKKRSAQVNRKKRLSPWEWE